MAQEPDYYTTAEKAKSAWIIAKAVGTAIRGKDPAKYDSQVAKLQAKAVAREEAEKEAREERERARQAEKAQNRAARWI